MDAPDQLALSDFKDTVQYVFIFLITLFVMQLLIGVALIPTASMEPTLTVGKKYMFLQTSYLFKDPQCGDIIVFDDHGTVYCKRIIGTPHDVVEFKDEEVYINGNKLDEPYAHGITRAYTFERYEVPEGEYFFMGDNRENSHDSRSWDYPFIKKEQILGKVIRFKK